MLLLLTTIFLTIIALHSFISKYYNLFLGLVLIDLYELTGSIVCLDYESQIDRTILDYCNSSVNIEHHILAVGVLEVIIYLTFRLTYKLNNISNEHIKPIQSIKNIKITEQTFNSIALFVFFSGLLSIATDVAASRIQDYNGGDLYTTPFYSYGTSLMIPLVLFLFTSKLKKSYLKYLAIAISLLPLMYVAFLTSRRQIFAAPILAIFIYILYRTDIKNKLFKILTITLLSFLVFGFQFLERDKAYGTGGRDTLYEIAIEPQLGEFIAIGNTTLKAWTMFVTDSSQLTYGIHFIHTLLNSIPFLRLGNIINSGYSEEISETFTQLAPWGGLSYIADMYYAFSIYAIPIFGIIYGYIFAKLNFYLNKNIKVIDIKFIYLASIQSLIIIKYRSGFCDLLFYITTFTILYLSFPFFIKLIYRRKLMS